MISVLAMTYDSPETTRDFLTYYMRAKVQNPAEWGHEYMRHLSMEVGKEFSRRIQEDITEIQDLLEIVQILVPYFVQHNAEAEAVDLLLEVERIEDVVEYLDQDTFSRVCLYIIG